MKRHRRWFLSVLPGLTVAVLLAWWFTPRPRFTVAVPEVPEGVNGETEYRYTDRGICVGAVGKKRSWVGISMSTDQKL